MNNFVDFWIHPSILEDNLLQRRARVFVVASLTLFVSAVVYDFLFAYLGIPYAPTFLFIGAVLVLVSILGIKFGAPYTPMAHLLVIAMAIGIVAAAAGLLNINSTGLAFLTLVPIVATLLLDWKMGLVYGVLSEIALLILISSLIPGTAPPELMKLEPMLRSVLGLSFLPLVVGIILFMSVQIDNTFAELERSTAQTKDAANAANDQSIYLSSVIEKVREGSGQLNESSTQLAEVSAGMNLATKASTQDAENQRLLSESMNHTLLLVTRKIQESSENLKELRNKSHDADRKAQNSVASMRASTETMSEIQSMSQQIAGIVTVIAGISQQTNLLALNASIEAARAGEHGRGFAVVADEVRTLAKRTETSAAEIKSNVEKTLSTVAQGERLVTTSAEDMAIIQSFVADITEQLAQITGALESQTADLQKTSKDAESVAEASEINLRHAEQLQDNHNTVSNVGDMILNIARKLEALVNADQ